MRKFKVTFYTNDRTRERLSEIVEAVDEDNAELAIFAMYHDSVIVDEIFDYFDTPLNDKRIYVDMPDGLTYAIPVMVVAEHKAMKMARYADDLLFYDAMLQVLSEFENDEWAIKHWATGEMYWQDVKKHAVIFKKKVEVDYQLHWANGKLDIK
ncbi:hypothetical protein LU290_03360 [Moraxella nasibovis]|uniref:hypothetical protein n=1 Tax=Moraxella nasibovis TaxID=2904120 RepID=UPI002410169C|nr:hypothetical protein [Moraxella nasibovis]WFF39274.1 hypothetical protein LU290_03360 [Moraxella nasibovis]